ncbi:MAG TPA: hypothetical protein VIA29_11280 [Thermoanaerobaculia bacterium]|jgi:hypothetical protein
MRPRLRRAGLAIAATIAAATLTPPALAQTNAGNLVPEPNATDNVGGFLAPVRTDVDLSNPVNLAGTITGAQFSWSSPGCPAALKIKMFRPVGSNLVLLAERGPFASTPGLVSFSPISVQAGDLVGITKLTSCGLPVGREPGLAAGYLGFDGDLTGTVARSSGRPFVNFTLAVAASGPSTESVVGVLAVVASTPGVPPSLFRTGFQMHNPALATISGRLVFHPAGRAGTGGDPSLDFALGPSETRSFPDLLPAMGLTGPALGTLDVVAPNGLGGPLLAARVFNDAGAGGTSGFGLTGAAPEETLGPGNVGILLTPSDPVRLRMNVGARAGAQGATATVTLRDASGAVVRTLQKTYAPNFFEQVSGSVFLEGGFGPDHSFEVRVDTGSLVVYAATADNTTQDPSIVVARRVF